MPLQITEAHIYNSLPFPPNLHAQVLRAVVANVGWQDGALGCRNKILELPFILLSYAFKWYVLVFYNYNTHNVIKIVYLINTHVYMGYMLKFFWQGCMPKKVKPSLRMKKKFSFHRLVLEKESFILLLI